MLNNPARQLYKNMDIDKLDSEPKEQNTGLLAPKRIPSKAPKEASDQPAFRVAQHMQILRKRREAIKNGE